MLCLNLHSNYAYDVIDIMTFCIYNVTVVAHLHIYSTYMYENKEIDTCSMTLNMENGLI